MERAPGRSARATPTVGGGVTAQAIYNTIVGYAEELEK
jgi:hypothetical protein